MVFYREFEEIKVYSDHGGGARILSQSLDRHVARPCLTLNNPLQWYRLGAEEPLLSLLALRLSAGNQVTVQPNTNCLQKKGSV